MTDVNDIAADSVAILERKSIFREGLQSIISASGLKIAFCASTFSSITEQEFCSKPTLILAACPERDAQAYLSEIRDIRHHFPAAKVVLIVDTISVVQTSQVWPFIDGFILRTIEARALQKALEVVLLGERVLPGIVREITVGNADNLSCPSVDLMQLSPREVDVLRLVSGGSSNKGIARDIGLSDSTVKAHMKAILRKLRARNRTEAAVWARTHGLAAERQLDGLAGARSDGPGLGLPLLRARGAEPAKGDGAG